MRMLKVNCDGVMLAEDDFGSLVVMRENIGPLCNSVFHVGKREYVKKRWNQNWCYRKVAGTGTFANFPTKIVDNSLRYCGK